MAQQLIKATHISEIFRALNTDPLKLEDLDAFYMDVSTARGEERPRLEMARSLRNNIGINQHLILVGYKGCGKSTELVKLQRQLDDDFLIIRFSIDDELDTEELNYMELIIVTMERLFNYAHKNHLEISQLYINEISNFLQMKEIVDIREKYFDASMQVGAEGEIGLPFLTRFFAKFKATAKGSRSLKTVLTEKVEPHFTILLNNCNDLIREIKKHLYTIDKKDLLVIIENLDKVKLSEAEKLFVNYSNKITLVETNVIYTLPIALNYNIQSHTVQNNFSQVYELPMIKVREKNGDIAEEGIAALRGIIEARMDLDLFENSAILTDFILYSGGSLRDLFRLIVNASESAQNEEREIITETDKENGFRRLKREYRNRIADYINEKDEVIISTAEYYKVLEELAASTSKHIENTRAAMHLKQNTTILGYNGEGWSDVHPIMKEILKERSA